MQLFFKVTIEFPSVGSVAAMRRAFCFATKEEAGAFIGEMHTRGADLAISVVGASMAYAWALSRRNDTLVDKIIKYHETVLLDSQKVSGKLIGEVYMLRNAIRDARCGQNLPDSDADPTPSRGEQAVKRRQERQERRSDT